MMDEIALLDIRPKFRRVRSNTSRRSPVLPVEERRLARGEAPWTSTRAGNERDMATDPETFLALVVRHASCLLPSSSQPCCR